MMLRARLLAGLAAGYLVACGPSVDDTNGATTASDTGGASSTDGAGGVSSTTDDGGTGAASTTAPEPTTTGASGASGETTQGTTGGSDPAVCNSAALIELKDPSATPDLGPTWGPGESVTIGVTLHNPGPEDFLVYPGIRVVADHPGVTAQMPENWLFALLVGQDNPLTVSFTAAADLPAPAVITFTIAVAVLNERCSGLMQVALPVDLQ